MSRDSTIKYLLIVTIIGVCVFTSPNFAVCSEKYYINNTRVLLYKIINWWYDSLPEESYLLCGESIKCRSQGNIQVRYDAVEMKIRLYPKESFADSLSVFKQCKQCFGPSYLKLTWLNKQYFGDGKYIASTDSHSNLNSFTFSQVERINAENIQGVVEGIGLELEGVICGLMDGKIALHHSGELLKTCRVNKEKQDEQFEITLKILNFHTDEILAKFSVFFDGKK